MHTKANGEGGGGSPESVRTQEKIILSVFHQYQSQRHPSPRMVLITVKCPHVVNPSKRILSKILIQRTWKVDGCHSDGLILSTSYMEKYI